jgi:predicted ATPase
MEASGYRKFGLLATLIRNEQIKSNSILFCVDSENSLNPELIPVLVDILLELSRNGVQIFIATHSEILASYFYVNQQQGDSVMFYSLYKNEQGQIKADSNDRFDLLYHNKLTEEPVKLYEKQIEKGFENG